MKTIVQSYEAPSYNAFKEMVNSVMDVFQGVYDEEKIPPTIMVCVLEKSENGFKTNISAISQSRFKDTQDSFRFYDGIIFEDSSCPTIEFAEACEKKI